ncbi:hypothetical protein HAHE_00830 [Haloferula helveola]|uniref:Uncharacterized protein n=1 Tax=Haloferula helveola TaxID=490095 RepID=A0ABM7R7W8_9BACT|nr:hypothetical protein HAHE_00830 [Haloferula helveola]
MRIASIPLLTIAPFGYCHESHDHALPVPTPGPHASPEKRDVHEIKARALRLPAGLPQSFTTAIDIGNESLLLNLAKSQVLGPNSRCLVDDGSGNLKEIELQEDGSYLGHVIGHPEFAVSAVLTEMGMLATVVRPGREPILVEPAPGGGGVHLICEGSSGDHEATSQPAAILPPEIEASTGPITTVLAPVAGAAAPKSTATLPPTRVMDVLEFEIGAEISSKAFLADSAYKGKMEMAQASAQSLVGNLDARFLHSAGIKHRLGTVIIRTDSKTDPLRDRIHKGDVGGLNAFRDYWNKNPDKVGKTHDLAVYHVYYPPSGIAYVNTVGGGNRYALSCGRGATSWANGTIVHEFGHSWNLQHNNKSGFFYEARPRSNDGAGKPGGNDYHVSIMHGGGNHNIGRLATEEADCVFRARQARRRFGDPVKDPGPIRPFGYRDLATTETGKPVTLDVIANDYDCNNDVLDVQLLDTVSFKGGSIALSTGTGPGRRNEVVYTPPEAFTGRDFFHYSVVDATGRKDWGAVYVTVEGPSVVDLSRNSYHYDLGPSGSPVQNDWIAITPKTRGDIEWIFGNGSPPDARERGRKNGVNDINRDFVFGPDTTILRHKLTNGRWKITLNMGDLDDPHDAMQVRAEGTLLGDRVSAGAGKFPYVTGTVEVRDGTLDLEFSDQGGKDPNWVVTRLSIEKE